MFKVNKIIYLPEKYQVQGCMCVCFPFTCMRVKGKQKMKERRKKSGCKIN